MRKLLQQILAKPTDAPDAVANELARARSRNADSANALDKTIKELLEHNRREPARPH